MWREICTVNASIGRKALPALAVAFALLVPRAAGAVDETSIALLPGEGVEQVQAMCAMCHSLDYIVMNSPFQDRTGWEKTVNKMIKVMGAPIEPADATKIVAYLEARYGKAQGGGQ